MSFDNVLKIVRLSLDDIQRKLHEQGISLNIPDEALALIARKGFHPEYGARPLRRWVDLQINTPLSDLIIDGKIGKRDTVSISAREDNLEFKTDNHTQKK